MGGRSRAEARYRYALGPLLLVLAALAAGALAVSARLMPEGSSAAAFGTKDRLVLATVFWLAAPVGVVVLLGAVGMIAPRPVAAASLAISALGVLLARGRARALVRVDLGRVLGALGRAAREPSSALALLVGVTAAGLALLAAWLLDPWAWDALGYHLPIAYDALVSGTVRTVPGHVDYINTYPRAVDLSG